MIGEDGKEEQTNRSWSLWQSDNDILMKQFKNQQEMVLMELNLELIIVNQVFILKF